MTTAADAFTVGRRLVTATYTGPVLASSSDSIEQLVVGGAGAQGEFCNTAAIAVPGSDSSGPGSPYPSSITVADADQVTNLVTVQLAGISHTFIHDLDVLLAGPTGESVILMSDTGAVGVNGVTLTFADGASPLPDIGGIVTGTYSPTNFGDDDEWPAPAPSAPPSPNPFIGYDPNGTWNLFVIDDAIRDVGSIAGGWCLNIEAVSVADAGGPYTIAEGDDLTVDASASPAGNGATYSWDVDGDGTFGDATGATPTLTWAELIALGIDGDGAHTMTVQITDVATYTAEATLTVTETATTVSIAGPSTALVGKPVTLKVSAVDPSPGDLTGTFTYTVDWGDGTPPITVDGPADPPVTHTYTTAGSFTVTATVTPPEGATSDPLTLPVVVTEQAPTTTTPTPTTTTAAPTTTTGQTPSTTDPAPTTTDPAPTTTDPAPTTTTGPATTAASPTGLLPTTGGGTTDAAMIAVALIAAGAATIVLARRLGASPNRRQ
jgi:subtilisin-like proprotein convertase family protein